MRIGNNEWSGYDTETYEGRAVLAATESAHIEPSDPAALFDFLLAQPATHFATWNIDYDVQASIAGLPPLVLAKLATVGKAKWEGFAFAYLPGKEFVISKGEKTAKLYDGFPFVQKSLTRAAQSLLGEKGKLEIPSDWYLDYRKVLKASETRSLAIEYCKTDARTALRIMTKIGESFEAIGVDFSRPLSPGFLAGQVFGERIPKLDNDYQDFYRHSYYGGRVEIWKRGILGPCVGYDLRSAYPSVMARMGTPIHTERTGRFSKDAAFGTYLCAVGCPEPLLPYRPLHGGTIIYPVGKWVDWYARPHVELLQDFGDCEILDSVETWTDATPLFPEFPEWYKLRKTDPTKGIAYKLILNSAYGKTCETVPRVTRVKGRLTSHDLIVTQPGASEADSAIYRRFYAPGRFANFAIAGHITSATQAALTRAALRAPDRVALLATDGILFEGSAPVAGMNPGPSLGDWDGPQPSDGACIIGCGFYALRFGGKWEAKSRGVVPRGEFREWFSPVDEYLRIQGLRGESLREATRRGDYARLNWLREKIQRKNVNADTKRTWSGAFGTAADCLKVNHRSEPLVVWESEDESRARLRRAKRLDKGFRLRAK